MRGAVCGNNVQRETTTQRAQVKNRLHTHAHDAHTFEVVVGEYCFYSRTAETHTSSLSLDGVLSSREVSNNLGLLDGLLVDLSDSESLAVGE
jgi:hypothetical protein